MLRAWQGKTENVKAGQDELLKRAKVCWLSCLKTQHILTIKSHNMESNYIVEIGLI